MRCTEPPRWWIERWPAAVAALSFRQVTLPLESAQLHALGRANGIGIGVFEPTPPAVRVRLERRLDEALIRLGGGPAFVRLGSRSAKDSAAFLAAAGRVCSGADALRQLGDRSARIAHDLRLCLREGWQPTLHLREWHDIAPADEWRGFLAHGVLLGVAPAPGATAAAALQRLAARLAAAWGPAPVVFDAWLPPSAAEARLIELNPWGPPTDAKGLDWQRLAAAAAQAAGAAASSAASRSVCSLPLRSV